MEFGVVGILFFLVSGVGSYALSRWLARRREDKARRDRLSAQATQSRQVRRARQRRGG